MEMGGETGDEGQREALLVGGSGEGDVGEEVGIGDVDYSKGRQ